MKKKKLLFTLFLLLTISMQAQVPPNAFNYSAVARDAAGEPIATTTIGVQVSIIQSSTIGSAIYVENHFVNTDDFGLFNLIIGAGAAQTGTMENIAWDTDDFYLQIGMDANGGTNFLTMGTTQLLSVPYALHAATADSLIGGGGTSFSGDYNDLINQPITVDSISTNNDTIYLSNGVSLPLMTGNTNNGLDIPTLVTSIGDDLGSNSVTLFGVMDNVSNPNTIIEKGFVIDTLAYPNIQDYVYKIDMGIGEEDFQHNPIDIVLNNEVNLTCYDGTTSALPDFYRPATSYYARAYIILESNITIYSNEINFTTTALGPGPAGGNIVFDLGHDDLGWQYLEISPVPVWEPPGTNNSAYAVPVWGPNISLGTSQLLGSGLDNTALMMANAGLIEFPTSCQNGASQYYDGTHFAGLVDAYILNGFNDWFIPSASEARVALHNTNNPVIINSMITSTETGDNSFSYLHYNYFIQRYKDSSFCWEEVNDCLYNSTAVPIWAFRRY